MPELPEIPESVMQWMPLIQGALLAVAIFVLGWFLSKWARSLTVGLFRRRKLDEAAGRFLGAIAQYTVLAAALIASLGAVGVETTSLVAVFASAGLAVGLALQGNLANLASGVMILFFRPFDLNDIVTVGGHTGKVHDIGIFATTLVNADNEMITIPNSAVTGGSIVNLTTLGTRRASVEVGVAYGADVATVMGVLDTAAKSAALVLAEPAPAVAFVGLGASSLNFKVLVWCGSFDWVGVQHNVRKAVYEHLNAAGIEIPYSQIVVHQAAEAGPEDVR